MIKGGFLIFGVRIYFLMGCMCFFKVVFPVIEREIEVCSYVFELRGVGEKENVVR